MTRVFLFSFLCFFFFFSFFGMGMIKILECEDEDDWSESRFSSGSLSCLFPSRPSFDSPRKSTSFNKLQPRPLRLAVLRLDGSSFGIFLFIYSWLLLYLSAHVYLPLCICILCIIDTNVYGKPCICAVIRTRIMGCRRSSCMCSNVHYCI